MIEAIPVPAFLVDQGDTLIGANAQFYKVFDRAQIGRSYLTVLRQPELVAMINALKAGNSAPSLDLRLSGNSEMFLRATGAAFGDQILICLQDINETATAVEHRQNFVADLGHELKTPLTAISAILETSSGDPAALAEFLPEMTTEVDRMKNLVADLLTLSRVEANERRRPSNVTELSTVVQEACEQVHALCTRTGKAIVQDLPKEPVRLKADAGELVRALKNLLENALLYGDGVVEITGTPLLDTNTSAGAQVKIDVCNRGARVGAHHLPRLTERFYRLDNHRSRDVGGSGLGLAIVKHVVGRHRGQMTIRQNEGLFCVSLVLPAVKISPERAKK